MFNTPRPIQNGRRLPNDILKVIFLNENMWISIKISFKFACKGQINNNPALVQIMACMCDTPVICEIQKCNANKMKDLFVLGVILWVHSFLLLLVIMKCTPKPSVKAGGLFY